MMIPAVVASMVLFASLALAFRSNTDPMRAAWCLVGLHAVAASIIVGKGTPGVCSQALLVAGSFFAMCGIVSSCTWRHRAYVTSAPRVEFMALVVGTVVCDGIAFVSCLPHEAAGFFLSVCTLGPAFWREMREEAEERAAQRMARNHR